MNKGGFRVQLMVESIIIQNILLQVFLKNVIRLDNLTSFIGNKPSVIRDKEKSTQLDILT